jgi:NADH-quinone oxidoreductase subunit I
MPIPTVRYGLKYGLGMLRGMAVTFRHLLRRPVTVNYPEEKFNYPSRIRAPSFVWIEENCTGCSLCAKACPVGVINIETLPHPTDPTRRYVARYEMQTSFCLYCGLCVEACPFQALFHGRETELATYNRSTLLYTKERLKKLSWPPSTYGQVELPPVPGKKRVPLLPTGEVPQESRVPLPLDTENEHE